MLSLVPPYPFSVLVAALGISSFVATIQKRKSTVNSRMTGCSSLPPAIDFSLECGDTGIVILPLLKFNLRVE